MANKDIPQHLQHKPIISVDYSKIDEEAGAGDAKFLSLGRSQWNSEDVSAKVVRWTGEKWSRQSEELPLWRILDLATLIVAQITGQHSSLNESVINDKDKDFLESFLTENMDLYQTKISELKSLLTSAISSNNNKEEIPNIFSFATSELSQDAILAWIISWADEKYKMIDYQLSSIGKNFVSLLTGMQSQDIKTVSVGRQWKNIDIWAEINDDTFLVIEDKTGTSIHDDQLNRYSNIVKEEYEGKRANLCFAYVKTENEPLSTLNVIKSQGYKAINRSDILTILKSHTTNNELVKDFIRHLQSIEDATNAFWELPVYNWDGYCWQGFYQELEKYISVDSWGYVNNPNGGFMGMWWNWVENDEVTMYLQFEQNKLCIKIYYEGNENRSEIRDKYRGYITQEAQIQGLPVIRPARLGAGTYMTIGILPTEYIFEKDNFSIDKIVSKLRLVERLVRDTMKRSN